MHSLGGSSRDSKRFHDANMVKNVLFAIMINMLNIAHNVLEPIGTEHVTSKAGLETNF